MNRLRTVFTVATLLGVVLGIACRYTRPAPNCSPLWWPGTRCT